MQRVLTIIDISKYHLDIMDLLYEGKLICFAKTHRNWDMCCHANTHYNIIFYDDNLESKVVDCVELCLETPEIHENQVWFGCPICGGGKQCLMFLCVYI